ncbi:MAG: hypothetical protein US07_C0015G0001, partial [Candidatus Levybacteria bacterium GW2011_GWB1_36_18]
DLGKDYISFENQSQKTALTGNADSF